MLSKFKFCKHQVILCLTDITWYLTKARFKRLRLCEVIEVYKEFAWYLGELCVLLGKGKQKVNVDFNLIWRFHHSEWSKAHIFYILAETIFTSSSSPSSSVTSDLHLFFSSYFLPWNWLLSKKGLTIPIHFLLKEQLGYKN